MHRRQPWLLAPIDTLSTASRRWWLALCAVLAVAWSAFRNGRLPAAWSLPDVQFYLAMAEGHYNRVPQPFSSRPLAPLLAGGIARLSSGSVEGGFVVLAYASLVWAVLVVLWLLLRSGGPRWLLLAVIAVPFWPQLLGFAGLPDPLYTALLATVLLMLELGWVYPAMLMMLPLTLARESTYLVLVCLLAVCWGRLRWKGSLVGIGSAVLGAAIVHRLSAASLPNPEHLSGGLYLFGKVISNSLRSVGLQPWSNVYPYLCDAPVWQTKLNLGGVHSVGLCSWGYVQVLQALWAVLTIFGVLPVLLVACGRRWGPAALRGGLVLRFCLVYGGISLLLAPALGTWYIRLLGYGWPLLLVALPRLLGREAGATESAGDQGLRAVFAGALLFVHMAICVEGQGYGRPAEFTAVIALQACAVALLLVQGRVLRQRENRV